MLVPAKYDNLHDFREDLALVRLDGKYGFIDKTGKEIIPLKYDDAGFFFEGLARVKRGGKWGFIDKNDKEIIPFKYDYAKYPGFKEGLAAVELGGREFKIDKTGKEKQKGIDYSKLSVDDLRKLSPDELKKLAEKASEGDADAICKSGICFEEGIGVEKDIKIALGLYKNAIEKGSAEAYYRIGLSSMTGNEALPKNVEAAISAFAVAAEKGFAEAQLKLGTLLYATEEYKEAMYWFRKAAEQGLAGAQFNLGVCYLKGHGTEQNRTQAVIWIKKAAEQGSKDAKNALAVLEEEETENKTAEKQKEIDYSKLSVDDLRKLAEQGDARVQCRLGLMYFQGEGVKQDYAEAEKWYRKAAEQGHATVQYSLGVLYFQGEGVKQDYAEAAKWFRKAAEQGDADAQRILGLMYFKGEGVKQDYAEAAKWFRKAAKQGNADAQRILCGMSFDKKGGVSVEEVIEWMPEWVAELAAQEGGKPTGGYSGGGNFEIDQAAAEKAKHDAKFREKVENVQRQIKRIDQEIAAYQKDRQRADNSRRNAGDKSFSPLEKNKSDYAHDMKKAEDKIRELEKEKKRLLDTLK